MNLNGITRFGVRSMLIGAFSLLAFNCVSGQGRKLDAQTLITRVAQKYQSLSSYQDDGVVISTYDEATSGRIEKQPFKLFFRRPSRFRVEWLDYNLQKQGRNNVVWSNG